jgi:hypothetical protein
VRRHLAPQHLLIAAKPTTRAASSMTRHSTSGLAISSRQRAATSWRGPSLVEQVAPGPCRNLSEKLGQQPSTAMATVGPDN